MVWQVRDGVLGGRCSSSRVAIRLLATASAGQATWRGPAHPWKQGATGRVQGTLAHPEAHEKAGMQAPVRAGGKRRAVSAVNPPHIRLRASPPPKNTLCSGCRFSRRLAAISCTTIST